ncbi:MAG TPA: efflux RND transporter periplasmic adaptor subunit [Polyangiaceae bacterium]
MNTNLQYGLLALVSCAALPSCSQPAQARESQPIPVKIELAAPPANPTQSRFSGTLEPETRVDLAFRVNGYVAELAEIETPQGKRTIDKGDFVEKGSVLARIRPGDYVQKLKTAQAQLSEARANQTLAAEELERARRLFAGGAVTKAELDSKLARADAARAQVEGAKAQSGEAAIAVGDTALRAPMDGVVLERRIEVGSLVAPGQPAISVADTRGMKAVFGAPQVLVEKLELGTPVTVFVGAESEARTPEKLLSARVTRIAPAADGNGRVFAVEALLPNPSQELRAGAVVSVRVQGGELDQNSVVVPLRSVIRSPKNPEGYAVFVVEGTGERGRARLRDVELGDVIGNGVVVTRGLERSARVVTIGVTLLRDGDDSVEIR